MNDATHNTMDKVNAAKATERAARDAWKAAPKDAELVRAWEAADAALAVAKGEHARSVRASTPAPTPWDGEAERAKAERLDRDATKTARDEASHHRTMDGTARRDEMAWDADRRALDRAMNTEPSDL